MATGYGFFPGGDPRTFHPDPECSTEAERARHAADCAAWDRGEFVAGPACRSTYNDDGSLHSHVTPAGYGLGVYTYDGDDDDAPDDEPCGNPCSEGPDECGRCYEARVLARFRGETAGP